MPGLSDIVRIAIAEPVGTQSLCSGARRPAISRFPIGETSCWWDRLSSQTRMRTGPQARYQESKCPISAGSGCSYRITPRHRPGRRSSDRALVCAAGEDSASRSLRIYPLTRTPRCAAYSSYAGIGSSDQELRLRRHDESRLGRTVGDFVDRLERRIQHQIDLICGDRKRQQENHHIAEGTLSTLPTFELPSRAAHPSDAYLDRRFADGCFSARWPPSFPTAECPRHADAPRSARPIPTSFG